MERIGVRELRQHASRYLRLVKAGETVEVTDRGELIALLVPPDPATTAREKLVATGQLRAGSGQLRLPPRIGSTGDSGEVLEHLRADAR